MLKKILIGVSVFAGVLLLALTWITSRYIDQEEIFRAKNEMMQLKSTRDSIYALVALKDSLQRSLQIQVNDLQSEASTLRQQVATLERVRIEKQTFPQIKRTLRASEVYDPENQVFVEYLMVPLWFHETFIIEHNNSENYKKQRDKLQTVDSLNTNIIVLKDSVFHLERDKTLAFKSGYDSAYTKYEMMSQKYINLLERPPEVSFGFPSWGSLVGSAAVGVIIGTQLEKRK
ncbi:MAG: hypothetical protein ABI623_07545 [bacterium]